MSSYGELLNVYIKCPKLQTVSSVFIQVCFLSISGKVIGLHYLEQTQCINSGSRFLLEMVC